MEIQKVIKELLAKHNFISLPGLGSFAQSYQPAKLSADGKEFLPPKQIITFDPTRTFNDEVLEQILCDRYQLPRAEAQEKINGFVDQVKSTIDAKGSQLFDNVGTLRRNENGSIVFEEVEEFSKVSSTFGLSPIAVSEKIVHKPKQPEVKATPQRKPAASKVQVIAIAALSSVVVAATLMTAIFIFLPEFRFWDDRSPAKISEPIAETVSIEEKTEKEMQDLETEASNTQETVVEENLKKTIDIQVDKKKALFYEEPKPQDSRTFYIISGSFVSLENAQSHFRNLERQGFKPDILEADGKFRVAMSKFSDRNAALRALERLRQEKPDEAVWLLGI